MRWAKRKFREANKTLFVALVVSVVAFGVFSWVVVHFYNPQHVKPNEKVWDWLITTVGTLFSLIGGLAVGALHLQGRRKKHLRELLKVELNETKVELKETLNVL